MNRCPPEKRLDDLGDEEDLTPPFPLMRRICAFCRRPAEGNHAVHRDGFGDGPEVPLCDACGGHETPTLAAIWDRISHVLNPELGDGAS